jgi:putative membrane protein
VTRGELGDTLALLNACLNASSGILVFIGRRMIVGDRTKRERHKKVMLAAVLASATFLVSYVTRVLLTGTHVDPHTGALHAIYLTILSTHMVLAMVVVPLVLVTLVRGLRERFAAHVKIAKFTYPIWLYVSVTGVLVYVILYRIPA